MKAWQVKCAALVGLIGMLAVDTAQVYSNGCPGNTVRTGSPCLTQINKCEVYGVDDNGNPIVVNCGFQGQIAFAGAFQCDQPLANSTCTGSGGFAPCQTTCNCTESGSVQGGNLKCKMGSTCQSSDHETLRQTACPQ